MCERRGNFPALFRNEDSSWESFLSQKPDLTALFES